MAGEPAPLEVVAGVLSDARGRVLIAERPAGKAHAGRWEFPGGKREPEEAPRAALERELREELGIAIERARPLLRVRHRYPGAARAVAIEAWSVDAWRGEPRSLDGQRLNWCERDRLLEAGLLEADRPIVVALWLPPGFREVTAAALAGAARAARERTAWIVERPPDPASRALIASRGEPLYVVDPAEPAADAWLGSLYTRPATLRRARSRVPVGCIVRSAREARAACGHGADFLLLAQVALPASDCAELAALGVPWYARAAAPEAVATPATGYVCWAGA